MMRLQEAGVYPQAFEAIRAPVVMQHGAADPPSGEMIRASLEPYAWVSRGDRRRGCIRTTVDAAAHI
jgi:hypothetical protein